MGVDFFGKFPGKNRSLISYWFVAKAGGNFVWERNCQRPHGPLCGTWHPVFPKLYDFFEGRVTARQAVYMWILGTFLVNLSSIFFSLSRKKKCATLVTGVSLGVLMGHKYIYIYPSPCGLCVKFKLNTQKSWNLLSRSEFISQLLLFFSSTYYSNFSFLFRFSK